MAPVDSRQRDDLAATGSAVPQAEVVHLPAVTPSCLRAARASARRAAADHGVSADRADALELVVSELVGNAVRHAAPPVSYGISVDQDDLLLVVTDADPDLPSCPGPSLDGEGGRGLLLVALLARSWGWESTGDGKRVWARL